MGTRLLMALVAATVNAQEKLQGNWTMLKVEPNDMLQDVPPGNVRVQVRGDRMMLQRLDSEPGKARRIWKAVKSARFQLRLAGNEDMGGPIPALGIYQLSDDAITLCWSQPGGQRPTTFDCSNRLIVLQRRAG